MPDLSRITFDPQVMGGKACIRGMRVTVAMILKQLAAGHSTERILQACPYLELEDMQAALAYAAWRIEERTEQTDRDARRSLAMLEDQSAANGALRRAAERHRGNERKRL